MSARRSPNAQFQAAHVVTGGSMCLYRNDQNRRFDADDQHVITELWELPSDIPDAYTRLEAAERRLAAEHVFAWHPEFGYLSPFPDHCGTGLHVWAEFHLEGLNLIGDLQPVRAGIEAMRMTFHGVDADGIHNAGHIFRIWNNATLGLPERKLVRRVMRTFEDLVTQELYARQMLIEDTPRIFEDSIMRALAILQSARLLGDAMRSFDERCAKGIEPDEEAIRGYLERSLMLVTALSPGIGYDKAAEVAKYAHTKNLSLREAVLALGVLSGEEFDRIVDPKKMV